MTKLFAMFAVLAGFAFASDATEESCKAQGKGFDAEKKECVDAPAQ